MLKFVFFWMQGYPFLLKVVLGFLRGCWLTSDSGCFKVILFSTLHKLFLVFPLLAYHCFLVLIFSSISQMKVNNNFVATICWQLSHSNKSPCYCNKLSLHSWLDGTVVLDTWLHVALHITFKYELSPRLVEASRLV